MKDFYTYAYLREDGTPYYIGKGKGRRITRRHYRRDGKYFSAPKDKVIYLKRNLTEEEAFRHEIYMISVLGRKDIGTGILRNRTNGGEGPTGKVLSEETKRKISQSQKGIRRIGGGGHGANNVRSVRWKLYHECGKITDIVGIANWCKDNGYRRSAIYDIAAGRPGRNRHKDIIKVEKLPK